MPVLAKPETIAGPLQASDLDRVTNPGNIYHLQRAVVMPAGLDQQGRHQTRSRAPWHDTVATDYSGLDDCAPEGGKHADPVDSAVSMRRHRDLADTVALVAALAALGFLARLIWPLVA